MVTFDVKFKVDPEYSEVVRDMVGYLIMCNSCGDYDHEADRLCVYQDGTIQFRIPFEPNQDLWDDLDKIGKFLESKGKEDEANK